MMTDLRKAIADKPVVVLAISTDTPVEKAKAYMEERKMTGPNILHGYDKTIAQRMGFKNTFDNFAIFNPESKVVAAGNAGYRYVMNQGKENEYNEYTMAREIRSLKDMGQFRYVTDDMSETLRENVFPMELGFLPSVTDTTRIKRGLKTDDRQAFDKLFSSFLDHQLADATEMADGEPYQKLSAFEIATYLSGNFKAAEPGKKAKRLLTDLNKDKELKPELAAKRMYDDAMKQSLGDDALRMEMMRNLKKKYHGTHYASLAASLVESSLKAPDEDPE